MRLASTVNAASANAAHLFPADDQHQTGHHFTAIAAAASCASGSPFDAM
jgi:hypothetical protein